MEKDVNFYKTFVIGHPMLGIDFTGKVYRASRPLLSISSSSGLIISRPRQITKQRSEKSRNEFSRLMHLKWEMILKYRNAEELKDAEQKLLDLRPKERKRKGYSGKERITPSKRTKVSTPA